MWWARTKTRELSKIVLSRWAIVSTVQSKNSLRIVAWSQWTKIKNFNRKMHITFWWIYEDFELKSFAILIELSHLVIGYFNFRMEFWILVHCAWIRSSVSKSMAAVASSRIRTFVLRKRALKITIVRWTLDFMLVRKNILFIYFLNTTNLLDHKRLLGPT